MPADRPGQRRLAEPGPALNEDGAGRLAGPQGAEQRRDIRVPAEEVRRRKRDRRAGRAGLGRIPGALPGRQQIVAPAVVGGIAAEQLSHNARDVVRAGFSPAPVARVLAAHVLVRAQPGDGGPKGLVGPEVAARVHAPVRARAPFHVPAQ